MPDHETELEMHSIKRMDAGGQHLLARPVPTRVPIRALPEFGRIQRQIEEVVPM